MAGTGKLGPREMTFSSSWIFLMQIQGAINNIYGADAFRQKHTIKEAM